MILTAHIVTGAAIASRIPNPLLGIFLAILSHYLLDLPPQYEYSILNIKNGRWGKAYYDFSKVFLDILAGVSIVMLLSSGDPIILAGGIFSMIPDGISLLSAIFPKNKLVAFHQRMIHEKVNSICDCENKKIPAFWGIVSEAIVIVAATALLFYPPSSFGENPL